MAMIDYGVIVRKNGVIINRDVFFMDMQESVGWCDRLRKRHEDCTLIDERGYSQCHDCNRANFRRELDPVLGELNELISDCHDNKFVHEEHIDGNYFAYVGDENFTVAIYKTFCEFKSKNKEVDLSMCQLAITSNDESIWRDKRIVRYMEIPTKNEVVKIKIRKIKGSNTQIHMSFRYKGDAYSIVYGYGIDSDRRIWNAAKGRYVKKDVVKFVDNFFKHSR